MHHQYKNFLDLICGKYMHCDNKTFLYSGVSEFHFDVVKINVSASVHGTTITFFCADDIQNNIFDILNDLGISPRLEPNGVGVRTPIHNTRNILNAINKLKDECKLPVDFANQVITQYPDGHGGTMDLNRRINLDDSFNPFSQLVIIDPNATTLVNPFTDLYPSQRPRDIQQLIDQTFFYTRPRQPIQMPTQGQNAKILSELSNFDTDSIPEKFCCPLSAEIMDDPVYDPVHPQYKFDRKSIENCLQQKFENPFTRTPLQRAQLISDSELKLEIETFVQQSVNQIRMSV